MLRIRPARVDEAEQVLAVWREAESAASATDDVRHVAALAARAEEPLLVAEEDGAIVATLIAAFDGWRGAFYRLAVVASRRRQGIASALVSEGERRLRAAGAVRIAAIVLLDHDDAVGFWRALGYDHQVAAGRFTKTLD